MTEWLAPAGVLLAAVTLTYVFCVRPMRRGGCHTLTAGRPGTKELDRALEQTRAELARLRAGTRPDTAVPHGAPSSTRDREPSEERR